MTAEARTDLAGFLLARIAEDEAAARAATRRLIQLDEAFGDYDHDPLTWRDCTQLQSTNLANGPVRDHIARHDPARVLAECEAKRTIVELHEAMRGLTALRRPGSVMEHDAARSARASVPVLASVLRCLALPYASHDDYDEAWRP